MNDASNWKKIGEWAAINAELEKIWEPGYKLLEKRTEIERDIPWLKGHGAKPDGPSGPKLLAAIPTIQSTQIIDPGAKTAKKARTEKGIKSLQVMKSPAKPPSDLPDQTQDFQGDPNKT